MEQQKKEYTNEEIHSKKTMTGILALILGGFGAQYFYLGKNQAGIIVLASWLVLTIINIFTCFMLFFLYFIYVVFLVQGIMILTMDDKQFKAKYLDSENSFPLF